MKFPLWVPGISSVFLLSVSLAMVMKMIPVPVLVTRLSCLSYCNRPGIAMVFFIDKDVLQKYVHTVWTCKRNEPAFLPAPYLYFILRFEIISNTLIFCTVPKFPS